MGLIRGNSPSEPLSEASLLILLSLAPGPSHGYAIIKDVERLSDGRVVLSTGTLYGAIKRMLDLEWIVRIGEASPDDTTRTPKTYALSDLGKRVLSAETSRLRALLRVAERYAGDVL